MFQQDQSNAKIKRVGDRLVYMPDAATPPELAPPPVRDTGGDNQQAAMLSAIAGLLTGALGRRGDTSLNASAALQGSLHGADTRAAQATADWQAKKLTDLQGYENRRKNASDRMEQSKLIEHVQEYNDTADHRADALAARTETDAAKLELAKVQQAHKGATLFFRENCTLRGHCSPLRFSPLRFTPSLAPETPSGSRFSREVSPSIRCNSAENKNSLLSFSGIFVEGNGSFSSP